MTHAGRGRRGDTGASAVEFALVLLPLLIVVFGIISYGTLFAQQLALNNGVRQGARAAVVAQSTQTTCAQVVAAVQNTTGPAIAMKTSNINVTVRTQSADGSTIRTSRCGSTPNPTSSNVVCLGSYQPATGSTDSIRVDATYKTGLIIPLPFPGGGPTYTLTATAVYRCEFSS